MPSSEVRVIANIMGNNSRWRIWRNWRHNCCWIFRGVCCQRWYLSEGLRVEGHRKVYEGGGAYRVWMIWDFCVLFLGERDRR